MDRDDTGGRPWGTRIAEGPAAVARTDFQALGYAVIVLLVVLFFLCGIMAAGAWALLREVLRTGDDLPPLPGRIFGNPWYWLYAGGVGAFLAIWPWK